MKSFSPDPARRQPAKRRGFTLLQLLIVISLIALLSALLYGVMSRGRATVRRADCDVHLKEIALALDTFRQETGHMPQNLSELVTKKYISAQTLRCPSDPELAAHAGDPTYSSYSDFYIVREPRDSGELPVLVCPFHESDGLNGIQAYKGRYTAQFTTRPVLLTAGDYTGAVTISSPGKGILALPTAGKVLALRGGDRIQTGAGTAKISFADGSYASIEPNTEMRILDSYIEGQRSGPLYSLTRQFSGRVNYYVNPGSHFDVATPTATAGALGTRFTLDVIKDATQDAASPPQTVLTVQEHAVALSTVDETVEILPRDGAYTAETDPVTTADNTVAPVAGSVTPPTTNTVKKPRKPRQRGRIKSALFNFLF